MSSEQNSQSQNRRTSDCPEWTQEPLRLFMEKLHKIEELTQQMQLVSYKLESTQEAVKDALRDFSAREAIMSELVLKQAKQDAGLKLLSAIAIMLFPVIVTWNALLQQDIKNLQKSVTVLETKNAGAKP